MKTFMHSKEEALKDRKWYIIDANDKVLGRLAIKVAEILRGKDKPTYTPHVDSGSFVVVINAEKVKLTGKKETQKMYYRHSEYPGGISKRSAAEMRKRFPARMIEEAVRGMIPHTKLGDRVITKLKVYAGAEHPHKAQNPEPISL